jgi:hypothetical protein
MDARVKPAHNIPGMSRLRLDTLSRKGRGKKVSSVANNGSVS